MTAIIENREIRNTYRNSRGHLIATVYRYDTDKGTGFMGHDFTPLSRRNYPEIQQLIKNMKIQAGKKS